MPLDYAAAYYEAMSPTLLAQQPVLAGNDAKPGRDWPHIFAQRESRLGALRMWRYSWWSYWATLAEAILPRRYRWLVVANTMDRGNPVNGQIVDPTATYAMRVCAAGMWTGLTSPSRPWFKLAVGLPWVQLDAAAANWLYDTEQRVYAVLGKSNFYTTMSQAFEDVATFGTAPVILYEDAEDIVRCYLPCAGEYYLGVGARLTVDSFYREFLLTVQGIVEMFGLDNCPGVVRDHWRQGGSSLEVEFVVAHAIEPNTQLSVPGNPDGIRVVPGAFAWAEVYWLRGQKTAAELSRRGFHERPFFVARWSTVGNDAYGRSPGMACRGDTKQLHMETRRKAEFLEKLVRPPMGANAELKNEPSSILPGHVNYVSTDGGKKGMWPLFEVNPSALAPMVQDIKEVQQRIERGFFVDVFLAISRMEGVQPRNELELTKRDLERLQVLGPFVQLFETEFASPAIERTLAILERRGALLPKPPSLDGIPLKIEYRSMLKIAQEASETASMEQTLRLAGGLSAAAKAAGVADPLRIINLDEAIRLYGTLVSFPSKAMFSPDEVEQHDQMREHLAQQQAAMQATQAGVNAAGVLSKVDVGGGQNAVQALLGQGAGGGGQV